MIARLTKRRLLDPYIEFFRLIPPIAVDETKLRAAAAPGAGRFDTMRFVILPATVPYVVTDARLAMATRS